MEVKKNVLLLLLRLYGFYAKLDLMWLLRDAKYAILAIITDTISSLAAVGSVFLLAMRFNGVGGMNQFEVLFMLGYVTSVSGFFDLFCSMNNGHISRRIGRGQLEHSFIQPLPISIQLLCEGFIPFTGSSPLICGIAIMAVSLGRLGIIVTWWWVLCLIASLLLSLFILLCLSYLISSTAFYAPVACEEISTLVINDLGSLRNYPLFGMPKAIVWPLITVLPYGLLGWFPSMALLGKPPLSLPYIYPAIIALVLFLITYYVFKKGFIYYVKRGANRYKDLGFRK